MVKYEREREREGEGRVKREEVRVWGEEGKRGEYLLDVDSTSK